MRVCLKGSNDLEGRRKDMDLSIIATKKQILRASTETAKFRALALLGKVNTAYHICTP